MDFAFAKRIYCDQEIRNKYSIKTNNIMVIPEAVFMPTSLNELISFILEFPKLSYDKILIHHQVENKRINNNHKIIILDIHNISNHIQLEGDYVNVGATVAYRELHETLGDKYHFGPYNLKHNYKISDIIYRHIDPDIHIHGEYLHDLIKSMTILTTEGELINLSIDNIHNIELKSKGNSHESRIYRTLNNLNRNYVKAIIDTRTNKTHNNYIYNIDKIYNSKKLEANFMNLILGSLGELAILIDVKLKLKPKLKHEAILLFGTNNKNELYEVYKYMIDTSATSVAILRDYRFKVDYKYIIYGLYENNDDKILNLMLSSIIDNYNRRDNVYMIENKRQIETIKNNEAIYLNNNNNISNYEYNNHHHNIRDTIKRTFDMNEILA